MMAVKWQWNCLIHQHNIIYKCIFVANVLGSIKTVSRLPLSLCFHAFVSGALIAIQSNVTIMHSLFNNNEAGIGGAVLLNSSDVKIESSNFTENHGKGKITPCDSPTPVPATVRGAILQARINVSISNSHFYRNSADIGGVILGILNINNGSTLQGNKAESLGGGIVSIASVVVLNNSQLHDNQAFFGGALQVFCSLIIIGTDMIITNNLGIYGAVLYATDSSINITGYLIIANNSALGNRMLSLISSSMRISGNTTFLQDIASLVAFKSNISFEGHCTFLLNRQQQVGMENNNNVSGQELTINILGRMIINNFSAGRSVNNISNKCNILWKV